MTVTAEPPPKQNQAQSQAQRTSIDHAAARRAMVDSQLRTSGVNARFVLERMLIVPREDFVPEVQAMRRRVEELVPAAVRSRELKLGTGGLRDVEFAVQLLQLVHGRNDESLHVASTVEALTALADGGYVGRDDAANMTASYEFLRLLEHRLQLQRLKRTHMLPEFDDDDVLIDVVSASVTPGDCMLRDGQLQDLFPITFPKIPGRDGAGIVRAVGGNVGGFTPGDRVCFVARRTEQGSNAERIARPADDVIRMPDGLEFTDAAALLHAGACAWIALVESAEIQPGMHVLIHGGSGAIGGMAVQIASHLGARVSATCRAVNSDYVLGLGADSVIAYDQTDFAEVVCDVDVVLDLVGGDVHERSCRVLRPGGILVFLLADPFEDRSAEFGVDLRQAMIRRGGEQEFVFQQPCGLDAGRIIGQGDERRVQTAILERLNQPMGQVLAQKLAYRDGATARLEQASLPLHQL